MATHIHMYIELYVRIHSSSTQTHWWIKHTRWRWCTDSCACRRCHRWRLSSLHSLSLTLRSQCRDQKWIEFFYDFQQMVDFFFLSLFALNSFLLRIYLFFLLPLFLSFCLSRSFVHSLCLVRTLVWFLSIAFAFSLPWLALLCPHFYFVWFDFSINFGFAFAFDFIC